MRRVIRMDPIAAAERIGSLSEESLCILLVNGMCPLCIGPLNDRK